MELGRIEVPEEVHPVSAEERDAPRFTLLIRAAKLIAAQGEFVCVIRDVSQSGVSLRGFHALPVSDSLWLELQSGERYAIRPVWSRGLEAGFRFLHPVEVGAVVAEAGRFPRRQLRLAISFGVELAFLGGRMRAQVVNLSQQGARIECDGLLAIDQPLRLCSGPLPEVRARVRWRQGREYGLVFDDTFSLSQLAVFAAGAQCPDLLAGPTGVGQRR
ncbi:hypothetical protein GCM10011515_25540 [Tsuneonella deserti]|uniref:PilZ domain-containing protein n=1 Tax=Tsuneonella deserti TaxID=2035528 RepID=A0ABQ1SCJ3_9SPHN|nr:PilZ domain-containing protein [Tsuneonella deserti]GGE04835.1 hypothetical protein GCM10011515_25540 [Tsuneonella deserti]